MIASMLQRGVCGRAVLTAVLCTLDPATIGMLAAANMLAPDGRCKTLDSAADGYFPHTDKTCLHVLEAESW